MTVRDLPCRASAAIAAATRAAGRADPDEDAVVADTLRGIARQHAGRARGGAPSGRRAGLRHRARARLEDEHRRPLRGPAAARRPLRPRRASVPLGPLNRRMQVLAAMLGLEGVSSHSGRRGASTTAVQAAGGWRSASMGRPLRLGRHGDTAVASGRARGQPCRRISPCTFLNDFGAMMSRSWAGRREPPFRPCVSNTWRELVLRRFAIDGRPVGSLRRRAPVQGPAGIVGAPVRFRRLGGWS